MTELRVETVVLPGVHIGEENPLPFFRDPKINIDVPVRDSVPEETRRYFGYASGKRTLPYRQQDRYNRQRVPYTMRTVILENDILRATFWVELGGRLMSLFYKPLERELLYNNPVFQPANLALRNAWFAGGIEWNIGQLGHSFFTCSPVFASAIQDKQGGPGLRLYEYERCKNLLWQTDFYLPDGSPFLVAFTRIINPHDEETSLYWWTNIAVPEQPGVRVLSPTNLALYIDQEISGYGKASMPELPSLPGKDASYSLNWPSANEFFFQCQTTDMPWETALDEKGEGLFQASTPNLYSRKLFCWGTHSGGQHWQEYLSVPGMAYCEIQAGLAPTQQHSLPMPGQSEQHWTEVFGYLKADPQKAHSMDWGTAWRSVDVEIKKIISVSDLAEIEEACLVQADNPSQILLQNGAGWGALECIRREKLRDPFSISPAFNFPTSSIGREQQRWLPLLVGGALEEQATNKIPGDWLVQKQWRELLEKSLEDKQNRNWYALLHYGVMLAETFQYKAAAACWRESIAKQPSAWAYRNLAVLAKIQNNLPEAKNLYKESWTLAVAEGIMEPSLAQEYLAILSESGQYHDAWEICQSLPADALDFDPIQILRANIALHVNRLDEVESALQREYASVREGAVILTDLWFELWRRRVAKSSGRDPSEISREEIETRYPPPKPIDFRMA